MLTLSKLIEDNNQLALGSTSVFYSYKHLLFKL